MSDQHNPNEGVPIWEALERWAPEELWQRYKQVSQHDYALLVVGPGVGIDPLQQEAWNLRTRISESLIERLKTGELVAAGLAVPLRPTSRRRDIPAELWPRLGFSHRFEEVAGEGLRFVEVLIREKEPTREAQERAGSTRRRQPVRRGPGRPSIMRQIEKEMRRRAAAGELEPSLRRETHALAEWAQPKFPNDHIPEPMSIERGLRSTYRELKNKKRADK